ncbi:MAG: hypothetical protein U0934_21685 [Pseudotabrizicola sp.]|uniref:hypothetical protein n=1 Tax=Pseudotabrizicola sp. TaxID=2939647 RepID=UPI00271D36CD|nr:hypothetical protein [Pseudotabrizicola sp.]MDO8883794.1 hypothetical protein [Pseudotabrizicola sp.]MDP2082141.1 hypothetical protein [Pseudotabrizicola sp.]MDZ7576534.1 hypothetical protein [Pseudotabrizicola sp.]
MRPVLFALTVVLTAAPAFAFGTVVDLPNLTWPQDAQTSTSTKGCETISQPATDECK